MVTKINSKYVENLTNKEIDRLFKLTLTGQNPKRYPDAQMTPQLSDELRRPSSRDDQRRARTFMLKEDGVIVSWGLVFRHFQYPSGRMTAYFYTLPDSRRKKYGSRVAKSIEKWYGEKPFVIPWDVASRAFFDKQNLT